MSKLDLNRSPYFDDFDSSKNYLKILFRPGRPVQARELNQVQTALQHQIESFANHIFKNGSKVSNARTSLQGKAYVRLVGTPDVEQYPVDTQLKGKTSGITATLVKAVNVEGDDPATIYVVYTGTGIDGQTSEFIPGEEISILDENNFEVGVVAVRCPTCPGSGLSDTIAPNGTGQIFTLEEGIFYFEGMFIETARQDIIVSKYLVKDGNGTVTNFVPCKIGLDFVQSIVTYQEDQTLLDPSLGYPNSTAPGADRYKAELVLVKREYNAEDGENFIALARLGEGMRIEFMKSDSEYSNLMDTLAKRTYETNGDYTIRPFRVSFLNSKKTSSVDPHGWSVNGDDDNLVAVVTPSVAYVKGYRVETISDTPVAFPKARDTQSMSSFVKSFGGRTYILARPMGNVVWPQANATPGTVAHTEISIYDGVATSSSVAGNLIGSFKVNDIEYVSGDVGAGTAVYKYYIYDLAMLGSNKFVDAMSFAEPTLNFYANAVPDATTSAVEVYNANRSALIYKLDRDHVKSLRDIDDPLAGSIDVVVRKKFSGVADGSGNLTFATNANEYFNSPGPGLIGWYVNGGTTTKFHAPAVASVSPDSLTLTLGPGAAGASVYLLADVLRTNQTEKQKTLTNLTINTTVTPDLAINAITELGVGDAIRLNSVKLFMDGSPETPIDDITDEYRLDTGVTDTAYTQSSIVRTKDASFSANVNHRLAINIDYYQHSGTQGYFVIDSYASALNASDSGITYETLPTYVSSANDQYPVSSSIDFRPLVLNDTDPVQALLPANGSTMIFDIEYYLGRADLLQINKDGVLYVKKGEPSESPRIPRPDGNAMALYEIWLNPYTYSLKDIQTKYIDNRRFTMRDIGGLEKRLVNVEYYTALSLLEKSAADMSIKDANGLDRYKNGFIADNFQDFQAADLQNPEFKAATDRGQRQLRPSFKSNNKKLIFDASLSSGYQLRGNIATLPYTDEKLVEQPYATKHLSINPYLQYNQRGTMFLSPNNDTWSETSIAPSVVIDVDAGVNEFAEMAEASGILGTDWGSWIDQNRTVLAESSTSSTNRIGNANETTTTTSTTTATTSSRSGTVTTVESRVDSYTVDDVVKDIQIVPFIRQRDVQFNATKMKPNTRVYAFFDGQDVSANCRDTGFQLSAANAATASQLVSFGSPLITDSNGELRGVFRIPGGRFFTGEKQFVLTDDPEMSGDPDLVSTSATAVYFAGGIDVTKQSVTTNVITPTFRTEQITETNTAVETETSVEVSREELPVPVVTTPPPVAPENECAGSLNSLVCRCARSPRSSICQDPVAQAFIIESDSFISSLDVFFRQVDLSSDRIFVEIRNMVNGYPGTTRLAQKFYTPDQIQPFVSEDSSVPFRVEFDAPVFVESNTQHCFVVGGASPNTRLWVARLGEEVTNMPGKIVEMPATGEVSFRSLNGTTWNAEQFEQIKYVLYKAKFEPGTMTIGFRNDHLDDSWLLPDNPFEFQTGQTRVRVYHPHHGLTVGDRVSISFFDSDPFRIQITDFVPQIGQTISTSTGRGVIDDIVATATAGQYLITVKNMSGVMTAGQAYTCAATQSEVRDAFVAQSMDSKKPTSFTLNQCYGQVLENNYTSRFASGDLAGVPLSEFNTEHTSGSLGMSVVEVDSNDTFIINVQTPAAVTGRYGGIGARLYNTNEKYDLFNVTGAYLPYRTSESWSLTGIGHGDVGTLFESSNYQMQNPIQFKTQEDRFLGQPYKVASANNEQIMLGTGESSIKVMGTFESSSEHSSPVVNLDTFSITTISNRIEWITQAELEQIPNADGRFTPETSPFGGSETFKYVTKNVNLAQPANDIHIYVDVYKDLNADFDIYIKRMTPYDAGSIDDQPWIKADLLTKPRNSVDLTDFIEYHIVGSEHATDWLDGDGNPVPFSSFRVKIVGRSQNSAKPPLFSALRIIAVT